MMVTKICWKHEVISQVSHQIKLFPPETQLGTPKGDSLVSPDKTPQGLPQLLLPGVSAGTSTGNKLVVELFKLNTTVYGLLEFIHEPVTDILI
jgi:hypothetical protein